MTVTRNSTASADDAVLFVIDRAPPSCMRVERDFDDYRIAAAGLDVIPRLADWPTGRVAYVPSSVADPRREMTHRSLEPSKPSLWQQHGRKSCKRQRRMPSPFGVAVFCSVDFSFFAVPGMEGFDGENKNSVDEKSEGRPTTFIYRAQQALKRPNGGDLNAPPVRSRRTPAGIHASGRCIARLRCVWTRRRP